MARTITIHEASNELLKHINNDEKTIVILYDKDKGSLEKKIKLVNKTAHTSVKLKTKCIDSGVYGYLNEIRKIDRRTTDNVIFICVPYKYIDKYKYELTNSKDTVFIISEFS